MTLRAIIFEFYHTGHCDQLSYWNLWVIQLNIQFSTLILVVKFQFVPTSCKTATNSIFSLFFLCILWNHFCFIYMQALYARISVLYVRQRNPSNLFSIKNVETNIAFQYVVRWCQSWKIRLYAIYAKIVIISILLFFSPMHFI